MNKWEIQNFRPVNKNTLRGFFNLNIGVLEIRDMSLHEKNDKKWVNFPAKPYTDKGSGTIKYSSIVRLRDDAEYWRFQRWAVSEVKKIMSCNEPEPEKINSDDDIPF